jgi:uncharacterized membrane protein
MDAPLPPVAGPWSPLAAGSGTPPILHAVIRPNRSGGRLAIGLTATVLLIGAALAILYARAGYWPVTLLFIAEGLALVVAGRAAVAWAGSRREEVIIEAHTVTVRQVAGRSRQDTALPLAWTTMDMAPDGRSGAIRLELSAGARRIRLGDWLSAEQRAELGRVLAESLAQGRRRGAEAPTRFWSNRPDASG